MNFVALDFETANSSRNSICAIGLVEYREGELIREYYRLVKPKRNYFDPMNVRIHGITKEDVTHAYEFDHLWNEEIREIVEGKFLIAHNAQFDMGVLRAVLDQYSLPYPMLAYNCTLNLSKKTWSLHRYNLNVVSDYLGIQLDHHQALDDARAAARIFLKAGEALNASTVKDLVEKTRTTNGILYDRGYEPARLNKKNRAQKPEAKSFVAATTEFDRSHPFYGSSFVFTGKLETMKREKAIQHVIDLGGQTQTYVEGSTNFVVVANPAYKGYLEGKRSSKIERTETLLRQGHSIEIISETDFLKQL